MRTAIGIIALVLSFIILLQSCTVGIGGAILGQDEDTQSGSIGLLVAILMIIAGAFAFRLPKVSIAFFGIAALFGITMGSTSSYGDLTVWGVVALVLGALCFVAGRKKKIKEEAADV